MLVNTAFAIENLVGHCGIRFSEALLLEKENFDLQQKTILVPSEKTNRCRKASIRPSDVPWFEKWLESFSGKAFPVSERTVRYKLQHYGIRKPYDLRKKLWQELQSLHADAKIIAIKLGYYVSVEDPNEKSVLFENLQEFEEKHFGVIS